MDFKLINGTKKYFIHPHGYCIRVSDGKDFPIPVLVSRGIPKVRIENRNRNMVELMVEHFIGEYDPHARLTWKVVDGKVPLNRIKYIPNNKPHTEDGNIFKYKCDAKAVSANSRLNYSTKITKYDVLNALLRTNFTCTYCGDGLNSSLWHLDHVYPVSKGGENSPTNITPSCRVCNLMKQNMGLDKFIHQCGKIFMHMEGVERDQIRYKSSKNG